MNGLWRALAGLVFVGGVIGSEPASAATVNVYLPKQILSFNCPELRQGYSSALRSSYVRLQCTAAPVSYAYGFRPARARGNVDFLATLPGGKTFSVERCGYLLTEISETPDGEHQSEFALDCRGRL